ncbi:MAG TPA: DNA phosphorothioation system sulfurtransferase DndC [Dehalococcoidia bacterium]|nr:DNA phosphorothioation system sulfurtransferase DndC [Dehalococcoidia bacterium]
MSKLDTIVKTGLSDDFAAYIDDLKSEIRGAYLENDAPWIVCFSGGKDSTALLQLVFYALSELDEKELAKELHVLSNDTLVENPAISKHVDGQLERIRVYGQEKLYKHNPGLFFVEKGKPKIEERFWVNLIGRGYPSPNRWFRWCTERLKINPTSKYIGDSLERHEKVIIVLGTRKAESANRAVSMRNYAGNGRFRNHTLPDALVYAPIADVSNDDVWSYVLLTPNPWGGDNMDLLDIYGNACAGGECPFVIETGVQSCGKSRFGCWVCTVVDRDKSMENFIVNGEKWMEGLLAFRNWIYEIRQEDSQYVPPRLVGKVQFGPFLLRVREEMLERLLKLQDGVGVELIGEEELNITRSLLEEDKKAQSAGGMRRYFFEMSKGERIAVVSDCNVAEIKRKRLGPIYLKNIKFKKSEDVTNKYLKSKRVMYYRVKT